MKEKPFAFTPWSWTPYGWVLIIVVFFSMFEWFLKSIHAAGII